MMRFHNFLKENASFQADCRKEYLRFPAGSSWMVYTDMVPHAVLSGQYALEQTFLVEHQAHGLSRVIASLRAGGHDPLGSGVDLAPLDE